MKCIALILLALSSAAQADGLGRLFFTPEQRAQLEREQTHPSPAAETRPSALIVNGIVQKRGGARTVWINGVAQDAGNSDERAPDSLPVSAPGLSGPVRMKVGQKLLLEQPQKPAPDK